MADQPPRMNGRALQGSLTQTTTAATLLALHSAWCPAPYDPATAQADLHKDWLSCTHNKAASLSSR
eukprot:659855-Amphidinium_carterae.1